MTTNLLHANDRPGEHASSWYAATAHHFPAQPSLEGRVRADVCIVGAGYTGLTAALRLAKAGLDVAVLEAHRAGWGASGRNGGQVATGQRRDQDELESTLDRETARRLWELAQEAKAEVRRLIREFRIDCDPVPGIIHADHRARFTAHSEAYTRKLNEEYGYPHIRFVGREEMRQLVASPAYFGGTYDTDAFHLHPLNYCLGIARAAVEAGARIYERSEATSVAAGDPATVRTAAGEVEARHVLYACNGYLGDLEPRVAARVMPINNFIVATEPLAPAGQNPLIANRAAVADSRFVINYFRLSPDNRLLFGGGESYGYRFPADIGGLVRRAMLEVFPQLNATRIDHAWGGTLAISVRRLPVLRRTGPNMLSASGYSGQGVTLATLAGRICAEAILGQAGKFDVFAGLPQPAFPGGTSLRPVLLALAMTWHALRDRI